MNRLLSSLFFAAGVVLVFAGLTRALGFTPAGILSSGVVIAALLYVGGSWFGGAPAIAGGGVAVVFDRDLRVTAGPGAGSPLPAQFPAALRQEIASRGRAALRGERTSFTCHIRGARVVLDIAPIVSAAGPVVQGVLISHSGQAARAIETAPAVTVA